MRVNQAFRLELAPNVAQRIALAQSVGAARFASHGGLARCREALEQGRRVPSAQELHKAWNRWKRENAPWWVEVSQCAPQEAFRDLERAFRNWRAGRAGRPRFKRKKSLDDHKARLTGSIWVSSRHVLLPRIGRIRTQERTEKLLSPLQAGKARILSATIAREADRWFVRLPGEVERPDPVPREGEPVGVDLGLSAFLVLSDGTRMEAPKPLAKALRGLRRLSRQLSRQPKGSRHHAQASLRLARWHRRIRNLRRGCLPPVPTGRAKPQPVRGVEALNGRGMVPGRLSRSIADAGWGMFLRLLAYRAQWDGATLIVAPPDFPSTRRGSRCGGVGPKAPRSVRVFRGGRCGREIDRDLNAAWNLRHYGLAARKGPTGSSPGTWGTPRDPLDRAGCPLACGDPSGGGTGLWVRSTSHGLMKQEGAGHRWNPSG
ncbi:RNA-guided endonuclease InsQ/TnpB family protein [Thermoflexus sp.]|uniref:RNA-guided endonuclease InsQ/TnpB family protein n=1 Tax=Thermoflexus sp. TaxID=1969742 RepID=UPI0035E4593E